MHTIKAKVKENVLLGDNHHISLTPSKENVAVLAAGDEPAKPGFFQFDSGHVILAVVSPEVAADYPVGSEVEITIKPTAE